MAGAEQDARGPETQARRDAKRGVSMRDLLASCAAARAVSTPPPAPEKAARTQGTTTT